MHKLKSHTKIPSKDKESTPSSQDIELILISTEVYFTIPSDLTKAEINNMGTAQRIRYWENW